MNKFLKVLVALKLFDLDKTLSLSNLMMMALVYKVATSPALDWTVLTALFLTLLNHNARKVFRHKEAVKRDLSDKDAENAELRLKEMESKIKGLTSTLALKGMK